MRSVDHSTNVNFAGRFVATVEPLCSGPRQFDKSFPLLVCGVDAGVVERLGVRKNIIIDILKSKSLGHHSTDTILLGLPCNSNITQWN
jgi:hypothetical protein